MQKPIQIIETYQNSRKYIQKTYSGNIYRYHIYTDTGAEEVTGYVSRYGNENVYRKHLQIWRQIQRQKIIKENRYLNTEADAYWLMQTSSHGPITYFKIRLGWVPYEQST